MGFVEVKKKKVGGFLSWPDGVSPTEVRTGEQGNGKSWPFLADSSGPPRLLVIGKKRTGIYKPSKAGITKREKAGTLDEREPKEGRGRFSYSYCRK